MRRVPALDGLRGVAAMLPLAHHSWTYRRAPMDVGGIGVDIFLVLSGALLGTILLDSRGESGWLRRFFWRRALRIWPLYYVAVGLAYGLAALIGADVAIPPWAALTILPMAFAGALTPGGDWGPLAVLWTIGVEEVAYLLLGLAVARLDRVRLWRALLWTVALGPAVRLAEAAIWSPEAAYKFTPGRLDAVAFGALVALALAESPVLAARIGRTVAPVAWVLSVAMLAGEGGRFLGSAGYVVAAHTITPLAAAATLAALLGGGAPGLSRALSWGPLVRIGGISYGVYLLHPLATEALRALPGWHWAFGTSSVDPWVSAARVLLVVAVTIPLAALSRWVLEVPVMTWGRERDRDREARAA